MSEKAAFLTETPWRANFLPHEEMEFRIEKNKIEKKGSSSRLGNRYSLGKTVIALQNNCSTLQ